MDLREEILEKLAQPPYRFTSRQIYETLPLAALAAFPAGEKWRGVDDELRDMIAEGVLRGQNGQYVRVDRLYREPPQREPRTPKKDPRQSGFGFGE